MMIGIINTRKLENHVGTVFYLICILLNSGYAYMLQDDAIVLITLFLVTFVTILHFGVLKRGILRASFIVSPLFLLSLWILASIFIHGDYSRWGTYVRQALIFIIAILFAQSVSIKVFTYVFVRFMKFATILSIIAWVLLNLLKIQPPLPIIHSIAKNVWYPDYYNGLIFFVNTQHTYRLMGPFWEPSVYACMTILALFMQDAILCTPVQRKRYTAAVFIIGIILSFSTTGYFLLILFAGIKFVRKSRNKSSSVITTIMILASVLMVIYADEIINQLALIMPTVFGKISYESVSSITRFRGPLVDLFISADNPLIGVGASKYEMHWSELASMMGVESRTSTITYFMANFGVLGLLYMFTMVKGVFIQRNMSLQARILLLCMLVMIVMSAPYYSNLMVTIFIVYLYRGKIFFLARTEAMHESTKTTFR